MKTKSFNWCQLAIEGTNNCSKLLVKFYNKAYEYKYALTPEKAIEIGNKVQNHHCINLEHWTETTIQPKRWVFRTRQLDELEAPPKEIQLQMPF